MYHTAGKNNVKFQLHIQHNSGNKQAAGIIPGLALILGILTLNSTIPELHKFLLCSEHLYTHPVTHRLAFVGTACTKIVVQDKADPCRPFDERRPS